MSIMFTIKSWYILIPAFGVYLLYLLLTSKSKKNKYNWFQYTTLVTSAGYLLCVTALTLFPIDVNIGKYANQTPWYNSINYIPLITIDFFTFILNIIMFLPLGVYLYLFNKRNTIDWIFIAKKSFLFSLSIEVMQVIIGIVLGSARSADINDLIANTLGGIIGYLLIR
ncbi:VanZ family protein [Clostridium magnum]|uniref:VanZ like family protein n=1 Tax=Clostridium magnum DSM 2767 TaxID=1121326 RepID=A0A162QHK4_9CLOT|nr:VanZ family protein [Clostridium magnum]KZL88533.1 VanZ like family protein [Clostridium magnum DSM 2767]SHI14655.1 Glycopeptide antibiotics resistance protein [Clostridium magnum DSM 2767]